MEPATSTAVVDEKARQALDTINNYLTGAYKIDLVNPASLEPAPKNARYMTAEQFARLRENIARDKALASVPLCWKMRDGRMRVLSGNHRVKAAVAAGVPVILVLYTDEELTRDQEIGIQLSHNAISGQDDAKILSELWAEVRAVEWKVYSGLDDKLLEQLSSVSIPAIAEVRMDLRTTTFVFLPEEEERLKELLQAGMATAGADHYLVARLAEFDRLIDALSKASKSGNVFNAATSLLLVLEVFERHLEDLSEHWIDERGELTHKNPVPLATVFGTDVVPAEVAKKLKKALESMTGRGLDVKKKWEALEMWAETEIADGQA